jgi:hypothetical protein
VSAGGIATLRRAGPGRFVASVRDRAVGREKSAAVDRPDGGFHLSVETEIALDGFGLRQSVLAAYDGGLRPEWCRVDSTFDSRTMRLEIDVGRLDAVVRVHSDAGEEERTIPLRGRPLLLVDNCFSLHAVAALGLASSPPAEAIQTALPAGLDLRVGLPALEGVWLAGADLGIPSLTLHLGPALDEHVWLGDNFVERLVIPQLHIRVDRIADWTIEEGGGR